MTENRKYHTLLPMGAQDWLRDAAEVPRDKGQLQELSRRIAVDEAIARVQRAYPEYFHQPEKESSK